MTEPQNNQRRIPAADSDLFRLLFKETPNWMQVLLICAFLVVQPVALMAEGAPDLTELSLEDLMMVPVSGASRFDQKIEDAPASVSIVTADDIQKYGYRTLADILRSVRGVAVSYDRNYSYAGLRGFSSTGDYNSRYLVQIDGHRINESIYNQAFIGTESIVDVDLIERVEVIRGPGASLYGSNAFFGVINIITKNASKFGQPQIAGSYGSFGTYTGRLSYGRQLENGLEFALSGSEYYSQGQDLFFPEFDDATTPGGTAYDADRDKKGSLFGKMKYGPLSLEGAWVSRDKTLPTAPYDTDFNTQSTFTVDESWYLDAKYATTIVGNTDIVARVYFDDYQFDGRYAYSGSINKDTVHGQSVGSEITASRRFFENKHRITAGAEFVDHFKQEQRNEDLDPHRLIFNSSANEQKWSSFLQDEYTVTSWLTINGGLCFDHSPNFGGLTNPRLAALFKPLEGSTVKLIYGSALRPPNAYELYYDDGVFTQRPDHLDPERNTSYEALLEQRLATNYRMTAGVFSYEVDDMIRQIEDPETGMAVFQNAGQMTAKGFEFEIEGTWKANLRGNIGYTYQEATDKITGEWLVNSPHHIGKVNMIVPFFHDNWSLGTNLQYMSSRKTTAGTDTDDVWLLNTTLLAKNILPNVTLSLSGYNLLNQKYKDPVGLEYRQDGIEQDGTSFLFKLIFTNY